MLKNEEKLYQCEGWKATNRIGALAEMHHIFNENYNELISFINQFRNNEHPEKIYYFEAMSHLTRYIFNFLSAAFALRDNCRKIMANYDNTLFKNDYQNKIKIFDCNLAYFVQDLRNYQSHYKIEMPNLIKNTDISNSHDFVYLSQDFLQHSEQLSAKGKQYIDECGDEISIYNIIVQYHQLTNELYNWLYSAFLDYHRNDLEEKKQIIKELKLENDIAEIEHFLTTK